MTYIISVIVLITVYIIICFLLYLFQDKMVYVPCNEIFKTPLDEGMEYEDLDIFAADGGCINGWYIPNDKRQEVVLFCHGNGGSMSHRVETVKLIYDLGFSVLIFDYRGYGISEGTPTEKGTYLDAEAALKYLLEDKGVPEDRIISWGRSLGGPVAAYLAKDRKFYASILESTFTSIHDLAKSRFKIFPSRVISKYSYSTIDYVKEIDSPILIVHSPDDEVIPYWMGEKIFSGSNEPNQFLKLNGDHNNTYFDSLEKYKEGLVLFFQKLK